MCADIFLRWHISGGFSWEDIPESQNDAKSLVDECLELGKLRLVCKNWNNLIGNFFEKEWNISSWNKLDCLSFFPSYDFTGLPVNYHNKHTMVREFLFSWINAKKGFFLIQIRPDDSYVDGRYDSYEARDIKCYGQPNESFLNFEYQSKSFPETRGCLNNSFAVEVEENLIYTIGRGCSNWSKSRVAFERVGLKTFISTMNYPLSRLVDEDEDEQMTIQTMDERFKIRYNCTELYIPHIKNAILTFLCINRFSEDSPIYDLPFELVLKISGYIKDSNLSFIDERQTGTRVRKYMNIKEDPWRIFLHK
jgi:hypothetical protein